MVPCGRLCQRHRPSTRGAFRTPIIASVESAAHAVNLLRHAPRHADRPLIGLVDPLMPGVSGPVRELFDAVRPNAQAGELRQPACFVSPSPMTHDPLFTARLLLGRGTLKATVVHDFIPWEFADQYLTQPATRHAYIICLRWLQRFDLFLPNSQSSAASLRAILGIADARISVAGAALDAVFDAPQQAIAATPEHVLVIGGSDARKNVECAVRGHARATALQTAQVPLVIIGSYPPDRVQALRALACEHGGAPHLLRLPGHVDDETLRTLYRQAICVIAPSRAEGFDLPVVEAMASAVPAIVSDIPAHRELVGDGAWRFAPDDHDRVAMLIERLAGQPGLRAKLVAAQMPIWVQYRARRRGGTLLAADRGAARLARIRQQRARGAARAPSEARPAITAATGTFRCRRLHCGQLRGVGTSHRVACLHRHAGARATARRGNGATR